MKPDFKVKALCPPLPWHRPRYRRHESKQPKVVLLHGLWRSMESMDSLASVLYEQGFDTLNIPYPSFRKDLPALTQEVNQILDHYLDKGEAVHFVTHSMGGIILRCLLSQKNSHFSLASSVMLAPPNQGSEIIDWLQGKVVGRAVLGPGGMRMSTRDISKWVPAFNEQIPLGVLMGNRPLIPFFKKLLSEDNDGIVSAQKGKLDDGEEFKILPVDHTLIMTDSRVSEAVIHFLKRGNFDSIS